MSTLQHSQVVSHTPGRTRFKLPPHRRNYQEMERIASGLQSHPDVQDVQFNTQTGSILVHHDAQHSDLQEMKGVMRDLGVVFADLTGSADLLSVGSSGGEGSFDFNSAISDLNQQVLALTNGIIDLRYVLPIGLGALAVFQLMTFGWQFDVVPWFVLAYFAIDSFMDLNSNQEPAAQNS
ncbi:MAG: hypothetical protein JOZ78_12515 [Chroococcidiopsidaceae cyanobacterium CP_BM_ER_R8_30]|nr:hypothetical protein [Chroococcidiopsidaceae cyanobacterium CP_BM_ER_R8_30]